MPASAEPAQSPQGFGNIPFGSPKEKALALNAGNGQMSENPDKTATLSYSTVVAGISFDVAQNFDREGRATDAKLTYSTREQSNACVDRFNFVLAQLSQRYGKPQAPTVSRREDASGARSDYYTIAFTFADQSAVKADMKDTYPPQAPGGAAKGGAAPAGAAGGDTVSACEITLQYLPPRWTTHF